MLVFDGGIMCWLPPGTEAPISAKDGMSAGTYGNTEGYCRYPRWYAVLEESFQLFDFTFVLWCSSFVS